MYLGRGCGCGGRAAGGCGGQVTREQRGGGRGLLRLRPQLQLRERRHVDVERRPGPGRGGGRGRGGEAAGELRPHAVGVHGEGRDGVGGGPRARRHEARPRGAAGLLAPPSQRGYLGWCVKVTIKR